MDSVNINNFLNIVKKMDEKRLSEGLNSLNDLLSENDKKKVVDMINNIKNQNNN